MASLLQPKTGGEWNEWVSTIGQVGRSVVLLDSPPSPLVRMVIACTSCHFLFCPQVGKPVMWRSRPIDKKKAEVTTEADDGDMDDSEFFS